MGLNVVQCKFALGMSQSVNNVSVLRPRVSMILFGFPVGVEPLLVAIPVPF